MEDLMWAFATLQYGNRTRIHSVTLALGEEAITRMSHFRPQQLSTIVWAFGALKRSLPIFHKAAAIQIRRMADGYGPEQIFKVVWGYGAILCRRYPEMMHEMSRQALRHINQFTAGQLANTLWGFAQLSAGGRELFEAAAKQVAARVDEFSGAELTTILWSFRYMNFAVDRILPVIGNQVGLRGADAFNDEDLEFIQDSLNTTSIGLSHVILASSGKSA